MVYEIKRFRPDVVSAIPQIGQAEIDAILANLYDKSPVFQAIYKYLQSEGIDLKITIGNNIRTGIYDGQGNPYELEIKISAQDFDGDTYNKAIGGAPGIITLDRILAHELVHFYKEVSGTEESTRVAAEEAAKAIEDKIMRQAYNEDENGTYYKYDNQGNILLDAQGNKITNQNSLSGSNPLSNILGTQYNAPPILDNSNPVAAPPPTVVQSLKNLLHSALRIFDPLVLDMDGDGVEITSLTGANAHPVYFDMNADGYAEATAFATGGDGVLCIDKNGDGIINDGKELFGDQTGKSNGFELLKAYDTNQDGRITAEDQKFDKLRVWIDANGDGFSQSSELHSLNDKNITSINLAYTNVNQNVNGNPIKQAGTFSINGIDRAIVDAYFQADATNTVSNRDYTLEATSKNWIF